LPIEVRNKPNVDADLGDYFMEKVNVYLSAEQIRDLKKLAKKHGLSVDELIKRILMHLGPPEKN